MVLRSGDRSGGQPETERDTDVSGDQDLQVNDILVIRREGAIFQVHLNDDGMMCMGLDPEEFGGIKASIDEHYFQKFAKSPAFIRVPITDEGQVHEGYARAAEIVLIWDDEDGTHFCIGDTKREFVTPMMTQHLMNKSGANYMTVSFPDGKLGYLNIDFAEDFSLRPTRPMGSPDSIIN
jgi:hypothetical protein